MRIVGLFVRTGVAVLMLVVVVVFLPADLSRAQDLPFPVELKVGETFRICTSGQILCPARSPICDDLKVAVPVDTTDGLGFQGISIGTTLCSAASSEGTRRVFRITVR